MNEPIHYLNDVFGHHRSKREFVISSIHLLFFNLNNKRGNKKNKTKDEIFKYLEEKLQNLKKSSRCVKFKDGVMKDRDWERIFEKDLPVQYTLLVKWRENNKK